MCTCNSHKHINFYSIIYRKWKIVILLYSGLAEWKKKRGVKEGIGEGQAWGIEVGTEGPYPRVWETNKEKNGGKLGCRDRKLEGRGKEYSGVKEWRKKSKNECELQSWEDKGGKEIRKLWDMTEVLKNDRKNGTVIGDAKVIGASF